MIVPSMPAVRSLFSRVFPRVFGNDSSHRNRSQCKRPSAEVIDDIGTSSTQLSRLSESSELVNGVHLRRISKPDLDVEVMASSEQLRRGSSRADMVDLERPPTQAAM